MIKSSQTCLKTPSFLQSTPTNLDIFNNLQKEFSSTFTQKSRYFVVSNKKTISTNPKAPSLPTPHLGNLGPSRGRSPPSCRCFHGTSRRSSSFSSANAHAFATSGHGSFGVFFFWGGFLTKKSGDWKQKWVDSTNCLWNTVWRRKTKYKQKWMDWSISKRILNSQTWVNELSYCASPSNGVTCVGVFCIYV